MARRKQVSRRFLTILAALAIGAAVTAAFWPRPIPVDMGLVTRGELMVSIDEEARTRVREAYVVSTPVAGRLLRVQIHPGDAVTRGETVVARMRPTNPAALDVRTREQALAAVAAAEAALRVARADLNSAIAADDLAASDLERAERLFESEIVSRAALDRAVGAARAAAASRDTAEAAISMRQAEVANARAQLIGFEDTGLANAVGEAISDAFPIYAPIDGRVLRVLQESETVLPAGAPIMEIGDIAGDLEIIVELISSDAVQVEVGDPVFVEDWGGAATLLGEVTRIDPFGVTKYSALGVAEQRVNVEIALLSPPEQRPGLGHGYRVKARIIVWRASDILTVPASALFRSGGDWAAFVVSGEVLEERQVQVGQSDGVKTEVVRGLTEGETVVLYPSAEVSAGSHVVSR